MGSEMNGSKVLVRKIRKKSSNNEADAPSKRKFIASVSKGVRNNGKNIGLMLAGSVFLVHGFGVLSSLSYLPDIGPRVVPSYFRRSHLGHNVNLAKDEDSRLPAPVVIQKENSNAISDMRELFNRKKKKKLVPKARWPVSVLDSDKDFETIIHPGDFKTEMSVPTFWSPPVHNKKLFSRDSAMQIGSCITPDKNGNFARGDKCPKHERTIFVAIASYRDWQCRFTVESIFLRARYPERIRVGVVDQIVDGEDDVCNVPIEPCESKPEQALCKYKSQVDNYEMEAQLAVGPVFARHIGHRLYRGEYYATQSDAHVTFTQDWDVDIIEQLESSENEMAVLSTYLTDIIGSIDSKTGKSLRNTRPIMCNTDYEGGAQGKHLRHGSQPEGEPTIRGMPEMQPYWAAGYSFSRGHFVVNVPYDLHQPMIFQGEEMSIGIRGFTVGYDFYAPERSVCFHHYAHGNKTPGRNKVKHFWENSNQYAGTGVKAMKRVLGVVHMNPEVDPSEWNHEDEDFYGLGNVRSPETFFKTFGIHVKEKTTEHNLCAFVANGIMHREFQPHLRSDGMGINYDEISYKFRDPRGKKRETSSSEDDGMSK